MNHIKVLSKARAILTEELIFKNNSKQIGARARKTRGSCLIVWPKRCANGLTIKRKWVGIQFRAAGVLGPELDLQEGGGGVGLKWSEW